MVPVAEQTISAGTAVYLTWSPCPWWFAEAVTDIEDHARTMSETDV